MPYGEHVRHRCDHTAGPEARLRRARIAGSVFFLTNGALMACLLPRLPEVKAALGVSDGAFGLALAAVPVGALTAGSAAPALIRRMGEARLAAVGTAVMALAVLAAGLCPLVAAPWPRPTGVVSFAVALFVVGVADSLVDVAQNAHALRVQRAFGRSIISTMHAVWSLGAVVGGLVAAASIAVGLPLGWQLTLSGTLLTALAAWACAGALPNSPERDAESDSADETATSTRTRPSARTLLLLAAFGLLTVCGAVGEDLANSWSALYLHRDLGADASLAALGFTLVVAAQFLGRLLGDRQIDRLGPRAVLRCGGAVLTLSMTLALLVPSIPTTLLGFTAVGYGVATLVPVAMHQADELPGLAPGVGLTAVAWLMRFGFLAAPPLVGALADAAGLAAGLWVLPAAGLVVLIAASAVRAPQSR